MYMDVMCAEVDELRGGVHVSGIVLECFVVVLNFKYKKN